MQLHPNDIFYRLHTSYHYNATFKYNFYTFSFLALLGQIFTCRSNFLAASLVFFIICFSFLFSFVSVDSLAKEEVASSLLSLADRSRVSPSNESSHFVVSYFLYDRRREVICHVYYSIVKLFFYFL